MKQSTEAFLNETYKPLKFFPLSLVTVTGDHVFGYFAEAGESVIGHNPLKIVATPMGLRYIPYSIGGEQSAVVFRASCLVSVSPLTEQFIKYSDDYILDELKTKDFTATPISQNPIFAGVQSQSLH